MSFSKQELDDLAEDIAFKQQLPYTLRVEKVEGRNIWTQNEWGNVILYEQQTDGSYKILKNE